MDKGARGWVVNTAKKNYWRVCDFYELDDLVQDGFLKYEYIRERYPNVQDKKHLMGLFKRAYTNHIHDLARKKLRFRSEHILETDMHSNRPLTELESEAVVTHPNTSVAIAMLPAEVRRLFNAMLTDPRYRSKLRRRLNRTRQSTNEFFCRLVGVDPSSVNLHLIITEALAE